MKIRHEVFPFVGVALLVFAVLATGLYWTRCAWIEITFFSAIPAAILTGYLLYFFRDPERSSPRNGDVIVAGADGTVASVSQVYEDRYLNAPCIRISIFLSLLDVHVNRAPMSGISEFMGYYPGKHYFTFQEKSSEWNQHNRILITGQTTRCLICQIVGPVCRRVVYWLPAKTPTPVSTGERIGMMKFGSRLDMYLPIKDVTVTVKPGDKTRAGETVVARTNGSL